MDTELTQSTTSNVEASDSKAVKYIECPCCHGMTLPANPDVSRELMDQYMACMITGTSFSYTYRLYDGKLEITLTQLDPSVARKTSRALTILKSVTGSELLDTTVISALSAAIQLLCPVVSITIHSRTDNRVFEPAKAVVDVCDRLDALCNATADTVTEEMAAVVKSCHDTLSNPAVVSGVPYKQLMIVEDTHAQLHNILMSKGFDKNFWTGIKLG